jgi:hypothetical protein
MTKTFSEHITYTHVNQNTTVIFPQVSVVYRFHCPNGKHFSFAFIPMERLQNLSLRPCVHPSFLPSLNAYILKNCGKNLLQFHIREFYEKTLKESVGLINITLHDEVHAFMHTPSTYIGLLTSVRALQNDPLLCLKASMEERFYSFSAVMY